MDEIKIEHSIPIERSSSKTYSVLVGETADPFTIRVERRVLGTDLGEDSGSLNSVTIDVGCKRNNTRYRYVFGLNGFAEYYRGKDKLPTPDTSQDFNVLKQVGKIVENRMDEKGVTWEKLSANLDLMDTVLPPTDATN